MIDRLRKNFDDSQIEFLTYQLSPQKQLCHHKESSGLNYEESIFKASRRIIEQPSPSDYKTVPKAAQFKLSQFYCRNHP